MLLLIRGTGRPAPAWNQAAPEKPRVNPWAARFWPYLRPRWAAS